MVKKTGVTDILILAVLSLIWGSSYLLIKWGLEVFSPAQIATLRLGLAAAVLSPLALGRLSGIPRSRWFMLWVVGVTGTALTSYLFPLAQTRLSSSLTGMLSGLTPLFTFILAWLFFGKSAEKRQFSGVILGLLGALGLAYFAPGEGGEEVDLFYAGIIMFCCFCYALSGNLVGSYFSDMPALTVSTVSFFFAGLPLIPFIFIGSGVPQTVSEAGDAGWWALGCVAFLAIVSTASCYIIFVKLIQRTGAVFASNVSYLIPVVALCLGLLDGESFAHLQGLAVVMVLAGVWLSR